MLFVIVSNYDDEFLKLAISQSMNISDIHYGIVELKRI